MEKLLNEENLAFYFLDDDDNIQVIDIYKRVDKISIQFTRV